MSTLNELYQMEYLIQHEFEQATTEENREIYAQALVDLRLEIWALKDEEPCLCSGCCHQRDLQEQQDEDELEAYLDRQGADQ